MMIMEEIISAVATHLGIDDHEVPPPLLSLHCKVSDYVPSCFCFVRRCVGRICTRREM